MTVASRRKHAVTTDKPFIADIPFSFPQLISYSIPGGNDAESVFVDSKAKNRSLSEKISPLGTEYSFLQHS